METFKRKPAALRDRQPQKERQREKRIAPDWWFSQFMSHFPGSQFNNAHNYMLNDIYDGGASPAEAARQFTTISVVDI